MNKVNNSVVNYRAIIINEATTQQKNHSAYIEEKMAQKRARLTL